eukprot:7059879-Prorocentrum_lima.AAC.1
MCIRDRKKASRISCPDAVPPSIIAQQKQGYSTNASNPPARVHNLHPVSYTHLTLPTICSV